jgi:pimeloyl-ACP methyl ester carboxylesterase
MNNLISTDLKPILSKIAIPTLIIWGREDKITPLSDGKLMHQLIEDSKLEIIENARHSPQFTHSNIVTNIIFNILK